MTTLQVIAMLMTPAAGLLIAAAAYWIATRDGRSAVTRRNSPAPRRGK